MMMMIGPSDPNLSSALKNQCKNLYRIIGFFFFFVGFQRFFFNVCKCVKVFLFFVCLCLEVLVVFLSLVLRNREKETEKEIWF